MNPRPSDILEGCPFNVREADHQPDPQERFAAADKRDVLPRQIMKYNVVPPKPMARTSQCGPCRLLPLRRERACVRG